MRGVVLRLLRLDEFETKLAKLQRVMDEERDAREQFRCALQKFNRMVAELERTMSA